ncbi:hypothetical protein OSH11_16690 [Kaistia dalseonensis]|uniref:VapC45 PIN like domain-containing protein n=1 Tax=Kaistia dalseonensis TaxID=410840 RepID=A0ABU0H9G7_9HYPH|nr:hypothetical protein [Kaistia dalseonensis]MCX5496347.1 hypothetical protein [Kaistia dalseonensis]MDQ0438967.1 hypothetical protein [Kaistia dalseonensis]
MKVLLDENLSPALAKALDALFAGRHEIRHLREKFGPSVADVTWINELSADGRWIVISGDRKITRNRAEYHTFRNSQLIGFFLSSGLHKAKVTKQMERILALWDAIEAQAGLVQGGAMFELPMSAARLKQL